ncbi:MAG: OmpA family protein [Bacteroidetes bacterium]|nr:OmpA family protein [Bacteroidota bacterium]
MIKDYLAKALLSLVVLCGISNANSQNQNGKMCIEANFGLREYLGDHGSSLFFQRAPIYQGGGINFGYMLNPYLDGVVNFSAGDVGFSRIVDWRPEPAKYTSFRANTADLTFGARFRFNNGAMLSEEARVAPFIYGGFGGYYVHSEIRWGALNEIQTHITDFGAQVQGGAGVSFYLSDYIGIRWSWTATYTMNDRWDGANSPAGTDPFDPLVNKLWRTNDMWGYHAIGITYIFGEGGTTKCKDKDEDGVCDKYDLCKNTPEKYRNYVDSVGCNADTDHDSIWDADDACPEVWGLRKYNGCPDTDNDGIEDKLDQCPKVAGKPEFNGCPDSDGDGIEDRKDECPNVAGSKEFNGCPDSDGDGLEDRKDKCPLKAGTVEGEGCPDSDNDGVYDHKDKCVDKAGTIANNGCPEIKQEVIRQIATVAKNIFFETNKDVLKTESFDDLDQLAKILADYPEAHVAIDGHTDSDGDDAKNLDLSQRRAQAVVEYLVGKGIARDRMIATGYGETKPAVANTTPSNKARNRRVEISMTYTY